MFQRINLNDKGISFVRGELSRGGELSQHLLELDLEKGIVFTYIPIGFDLSDFNDYSESMEFIVSERVVDKFEEISSKVIYEFLDRGPRNIAIFETLWNINDPIVSKRGHQYFLIKSMVYDFILGSNTKKPIKLYLRGAQSYPTVIVLSTNFHSEDLLHNLDLNENMQNKITENIDSLIVGAFDGEGFVFWTKQ